jgi:uncharacterized protein YbgA (DUF1722 family)/uncharacterized protein YbbK (DUF523 family)
MADSERNNGSILRVGLRIGVSACLVGERVRFDGGHKLNHFLTEELGRFVELVPVCPEVDIGLGIPRETIRLVQIGKQRRLVAPASGANHTDKMRRYAERKLRELMRLELSGYVLKSKSPTCGMERVPVYGENGMRLASGTGAFAEALLATLPLLPVEEEGRLLDLTLRENFVERVFAYRRMRDLFRAGWTRGGLVAFHTKVKLQVMAHDTTAYTALGQLVARVKQIPRGQLEARYQDIFMRALARTATRRRNTNVLQHVAGYFKHKLTADQKVELQEVIRDFHDGLVPLIVPVTLLRHYVRLHGDEYLAAQLYLAPHPKELMLRNHA